VQRKRHRPSLGKSLTYELLAIETGRKTVDDEEPEVKDFTATLLSRL